MHFLDDVRNNILLEMSQRIDPIKLDNSAYFKRWEAIKQKTQEMPDVLEIYGNALNVHYLLNANICEFFFLLDNRLVFQVTAEILDDSGVEIIESCKFGASGMFMSDIYKHFLLKHFSYILSDMYHTDRGFAIYSILSKDDELITTIVDVDNNTEFPLDKPDDIRKYFGGDDKAQYVYKVKKL